MGRWRPRLGAGMAILARLLGALPVRHDADSVLFSGTRWAARSRLSTMSWPAARGSCTCSSTPTGRPAPTPLAARRGSANKTPPMEVATLATYYLSAAAWIRGHWNRRRLRSLRVRRLSIPDHAQPTLKPQNKERLNKNRMIFFLWCLQKLNGESRRKPQEDNPRSKFNSSPCI